MIELSHVSMCYPQQRRYREYLLNPFRSVKRFTALRDVSLTLARSDHLAVLGPNGAGKTTFLKLIGGLLLPTSGVVTVGGNDTRRHNGAARRSVGYVMNEERSFYWRLTGLQNLEFFGALDNMYEPQLHRTIRNLCDLVGLTHALEKPVGTYSSGMKQKLAIVRGLLTNPDILILDEPTRTLDPIAADEMVGLIRDIVGKDMAKIILISTHRLDLVPILCNRVCIINNATIVAQDRVDDVVRSDPTLLEYYKRYGHVVR